MTGTGDAAAMTTAPAGTPEQARAAILAHPAVTRVREALAGFGVTTEVVVLDGAARTTRALGQCAGRMTPVSSYACSRPSARLSLRKRSTLSRSSVVSRNAG